MCMNIDEMVSTIYTFIKIFSKNVTQKHCFSSNKSALSIISSRSPVTDTSKIVVTMGYLIISILEV